MLSFSNFGSNRDPLCQKVAEATRMLHQQMPDVLVDGDIQANIALRPDLMQEFFPFNALAEKGANTFIFPNLASANISYKLLQELGDLEAIGPVLLGLRRPAHVLQMGCSVREIVNMAAIAVVDAQSDNTYF
jgi:malate dehydrogenase (oxaloacetate-decarboxylating)(NADP+)